MKRETIILVLGVLVMLSPFIGVPSMWKRIGYLAVGFALFVFGYQLRRAAYLRSLERGDERRGDMFAERMPDAAQSAAAEPKVHADTTADSETTPSTESESTAAPRLRVRKRSSAARKRPARIAATGPEEETDA